MFFTVCDVNVNCDKELWMAMRYVKDGWVMTIRRKFILEDFIRLYATWKDDKALYAETVRNIGLPWHAAYLLEEVFMYSETFKDVILYGGGQCRVESGAIGFSTHNMISADAALERVRYQNLEV